MKLILHRLFILLLAISCGPIAVGQTFEWNRYSTGNPGEFRDAAGEGIAMDANGNRYVAGSFHHTIYIGNDSLISMGGTSDIFVAKYDSAGNYLWSRQAGGLLNDWGRDIAVDDSGNCYITGTYAGTAWFDTLSIVSFANLDDIFLAKYDTDGNFRWVARIGSQVEDVAQSIAVNKNSQVFLTGNFRIFAYLYDARAPVPSDTIYSFTAQFADAFTACYSGGGGLLWAREANGTVGSAGRTVATDRRGDVLVAGEFSETLFLESQSLVSEGRSDIFIARYRDSGELLSFSSLGSSGREGVTGISVDSSDNIYLSGSLSDSLILGQDTLDWVNGGGSFLAKFDANHNPLWARQAISFNFTGINFRDVDVTGDGQCYLTGSFNGARAIFGDDTLRSGPGSEEMFTAHYNSAGDIIWAVQAGNTDASVIGYDIAVGAGNRPSVTGKYSGYSIFGGDTLSGGPGFFLSKFRTDPMVGINDRPAVPANFQLAQNYPNPFNPETVIGYSLSVNRSVELKIYDVLGREVQILVHERQQHPGNYSVSWDGRNQAGNPVSSGYYFYRLTAGEYSQTRRMLLLK